MARVTVGVWLAIAALGASPQSQDLVATSDAGAHVGKTKIVCADVAAVRRDGNDTILELDAAPNPPVLVAVTNRARQAFVPAFETTVVRSNVCARGKIERKSEGLRIRIDDSMMLRATERRPNGRAGFAEGIPPAVSPGVVLPQTVTSPNPKYTPNGMKAKIKGEVEMEGVLQPDGRIGEVRVVKSLDSLFGLDAEAVRAFKQWRFKPATRNGQPVAVVVTVVMSFNLH